MKIVKILGGLGNQMFQYALYVSLCHRFPYEKVKIDTTCFCGYPLHNGFELEKIFNIQATHANIFDLFRIAYPYSHYRLWQIGKRILPKRRTILIESANEEFDRSALDREGDCYFDGYWQNEKYFIDFRDEILKIFKPKNIDSKNYVVANELAECCSVSLHVRRGDYNNNPLYSGICDEKYYIDAIQKIQSKVNVDMFCIFSNDIKWCKEHLPSIIGNKRILFVDWNTGINSYKDMYLMSVCHHNIIANSSFSWWGEWLNNHKNKIVLCPKKWNNIKNSKFEIPSRWEKI